MTTEPAQPDIHLVEQQGADPLPTPIAADHKSSDLLYAYAERYLMKVWASRGSRFVASRRLHKKNYACQLVLSFFSLTVIGAGVGLLVLPPDYKMLSNLISVLSIDASVFILVLSNLEFAKNYGVEADRMLKGAQALSPLYDEIERSIRCKLITQQKIDSFIQQYNHIINEFEVNHEDIDYLYFQTMHPRRFHLTGWHWFRRIKIKIGFFGYIWGLYIFSIIIPPILIGLAMYGLPQILHLFR